MSNLVLVVEDDEVSGIVASMNLKRLGFDPHVVRTGQMALEAFGTQNYCLVLMDVMLPGMDGLTAVRRIRELERKYLRERTPVIGVTAWIERKTSFMCFDAGMDDYLLKPYEGKDFEATISKHVRATTPTVA